MVIAVYVHLLCLSYAHCAEGQLSHLESHLENGGSNSSRGLGLPRGKNELVPVKCWPSAWCPAGAIAISAVVTVNAIAELECICVFGVGMGRAGRTPLSFSTCIMKKFCSGSLAWSKDRLQPTVLRGCGLG